MLFDALRHGALTSTAWNAQSARTAIEAIVADTARAFDARALIWALQKLREDRLADFDIDFGPTIRSLPARNRAMTEAWGHGTASYLMGDSGLLLLAFQHTRDGAVADALHEAVQGNLRHLRAKLCGARRVRCWPLCTCTR